MSGEAKGTGGRRTRTLADLVREALSPAAKKRGLATADLLAVWPEIVGPRYADLTRPERLKRGGKGAPGATLFVRCDPSVTLDFSFETRQVLERIGRLAGGNGVAAIRIVPGAMPARPPVADAPDLPDPAADAALDTRLGGLDEALRGSFRALGRAIRRGAA